MDAHKLPQILRIGHPLLRQKSTKVDPKEISTPKIQTLIDTMFAVLKQAGGQGLAAPQIGELVRIVVIVFDRQEAKGLTRYEKRILINPEITKPQGKPMGSWEGCLSVPEMRGYVERPSQINLKYLDETGNSHSEMIKGYDAIVYQHECDHLDGVLYVDKLMDRRLFGYEEEDLGAIEEEIA